MAYEEVRRGMGCLLLAPEISLRRVVQIRCSPPAFVANDHNVDKPKLTLAIEC
jgi:hypothetical protein